MDGNVVDVVTAAGQFWAGLVAVASVLVKVGVIKPHTWVARFVALNAGER